MQEEFIFGNVKRAQRGSRKENVTASEELVCSGTYSYRYLWNWAKLPDHLKTAKFRGVAWAPNGIIYAATDCPTCSVAAFDQDGHYLQGIGTQEVTGSVHNISVDHQGNLWLASTSRHVILQYDLQGNLLRVLGTYDTPSDSGINDDCAPSRWRWNTIRHMAGPFNRPTRLVEGIDGDLFASDGYGNAAIHRFNSSGILQQTWGGSGKEPGHLTIPHSLWADKEGRILVADCEADRVQIFSPDGLLISSINNLLYPMDVVSDDNLIYIAEREGRISIFNYDLVLQAQLGYFSGPYAAHSLAVDTQGSLYFSSLWIGNGLCKLLRVISPESGGME